MARRLPKVEGLLVGISAGATVNCRSEGGQASRKCGELIVAIRTVNSSALRRFTSKCVGGL